MASIRNYCLTVAGYSVSRPPRLFAKTDESNQTGGWDAFSSKAEWEQAGKPQPVAFAWYNENKVVRAVFLSKNNGDGGRYAEYCYRGDGHLALLCCKRTLPPFATTLTFVATSHFRESGFIYPQGKSST